MILTSEVEDKAVRGGTAALGLVLMASAYLAAEPHGSHQHLLGAICGAGHAPPCGWCYGAAGLAFAGLAALLASLSPYDWMSRAASHVGGS